ncbi:GTPase HflX [Terribacillus saccharophilus]|nr:GTPase HflX [Terribacillus saccharophilus]MEC0283242.1 GTPase HflX [Terribacillus saccharophilus]MEC0290198.1 GTPase HflX [Terribacillus saccharophilus]
MERVLLMAVHHQNQTLERFQSSLDELEALTETAGGEVAGIVTQKRERLHPGTYFGSGKLEELAELVEQEEPLLVISNDELSPGQLKNISNRVGVRVIDRSQLILDIFATRAHTREGKLQVELAQMQYLLPRLYGQGTEMSRLGAGIGTRGPGETKLETDRRHIRRRIDEIKHQLKAVVSHRSRYRERRKANQAFQVALVGYTNAGKSTIFNRVTGNDSLEQDQLFATLDPMTRRMRLPSGFQALLTDTVGFIQDLPTALIAAFRSTLEEVTEADFIIHMVNSAHPDHEQQQNTVLKLLKELGADKLPILTVYNKADLLTEDFIASAHPYVQISAFKEEDRRLVMEKVQEMIQEASEFYDTIVPATGGRLLDKLAQETILTKREYNEEMDAYEVNGYVLPNNPLFHQLKGKNEA